MNRFIKYLCLCCVLAPWLAMSAGGEPSETPEAARARAKLADIRARISALTNRLGEELKERDALGARLREADLDLTAKRRQWEALRSEQQATLRRRGELRAEQSQTQTALDAQRAALAAQVRAAYMLGQQEQIKLLLNQSDPAAAGRMVTYYGYLARERGAKIADIRERVTKLQELSRQIDLASQALQNLQADATREMAALQVARENRLAALAAASKQVSGANQELGDLKRQEQAEEALVTDLARVLQDFPVDTPQSFEGLRGKLPWPVPGRMSARYQEPRQAASASGLRWNGVLIDGARGAKVRAPYFGRVVYADWLQGLGLLLIIGHSGNYMTLYGHAEVLYKSVGDWVAPGDVIASLSDSGGATPQLYFEIREGRKPMDPKLWLKAAP